MGRLVKLPDPRTTVFEALESSVEVGELVEGTLARTDVAAVLVPRRTSLESSAEAVMPRVLPLQLGRRLEASEDLLEEKGKGQGAGNLVDEPLEAAAAEPPEWVVVAAELAEVEEEEAARHRCRAAGVFVEGADDVLEEEVMEAQRLPPLRLRSRRV